MWKRVCVTNLSSWGQWFDTIILVSILTISVKTFCSYLDQLHLGFPWNAFFFNFYTTYSNRSSYCAVVWALTEPQTPVSSNTVTGHDSSVTSKPLHAATCTGLPAPSSHWSVAYFPEWNTSGMACYAVFWMGLLSKGHLRSTRTVVNSSSLTAERSSFAWMSYGTLSLICWKDVQAVFRFGDYGKRRFWYKHSFQFTGVNRRGIVGLYDKYYLPL